MTVTTTSVIWIITSVSRKSFDFPTLNTCCVCTTYFFLFFFPCLLLTSLETFTPRKDLKCTMKETYSTFKCLYFISLLPFDIPKRNTPCYAGLVHSDQWCRVLKVLSSGTISNFDGTWTELDPCPKWWKLTEQNYTQKCKFQFHKMLKLVKLLCVHT